MMDELINEVSQKTGLSPDQTKEVVDAVVGFLQKRLPAPLGGALSSLVGGSDGSGDAGTGSQDSGQGLAAEASAVLGSLFGKS